MGDRTKDFINKMKERSASNCKKVAEAVDEMFDGLSPDEVIKQVIEMAHKVDDDMLGYFIFPDLKRKAEKDKTLFAGIQKLVQQSDVPDNVRVYCIDLIDKLFREKYRSYPADYVDFICATAVNPAIPDVARARAARLLARVRGKKQLDTLRELISSKKAELVDAACNTVSRWPKEKLGRQRDLVRRVMGFVEDSPAGAIKCPMILRTLAESNMRGSGDVLDRVVENSETEEDWLRLAACMGPNSSTKQLAKIINGIMSEKDEVGPLAKITIRRLFEKDRSKLESLYNDKHYSEYLDSISAYPALIGKSAISYLEKLERRKDPKNPHISIKAGKLKQDLKTARCNAFLPSALVRSRKEVSADVVTEPTNTIVKHQSKPTGFHMGDALYRDTHLREPFTHNHWHAGIFLGFGFESDGGNFNGKLQGLHMSGIPGKVKQFSAQNGFGNPECNVANEMMILLKEFKEEFALHRGGEFHGARRTKLICRKDRENIVKKAVGLMDQGIGYTFWDMLVSWWDWDGSVSDIALLRCDGLVEYIYEKCGIKVCAGTEVSKWNIAAPGDEHLESHADLHTWNLEPGELCPKVQAGKDGSDTTFSEPCPSVPVVQKFIVKEVPASGGNIISIRLNVKSSEYYNVFVRITVKALGDRVKFLTSIGAPDFPAGIAGQWRFKAVNEGTNHVAYWLNDTSGTDNNRAGGEYEFRVVAVDKGGNVSEEHACKIQIT